MSFEIAEGHVKITTDMDGALREAISKLRTSERDFDVAGDRAGASWGKAAGKAITSQRDTDKATEKVAKRANAQFSALSFGAMFAGLPAASAVAGAGIAAGLAAVPIAFAGIAVAALASEKAVTDAWGGMAETVSREVKAMAAPMQGELVAAAHTVENTFIRLQPEISQLFEGAAGTITILTDAVLGFAENAMPGLITAVENSKPALLGLKTLAEETGAGLTLFFQNISTASASSGQILASLGGIVRDTLGFLGQFLANLANNGGPILDMFGEALNKVYSILLNVTSEGSALYDVFGGFTQAVSTAFTAITPLIAALSAIPAPIAEILGVMLAASKIAGIFGLNLGNAFRGVGTSIAQAEGAAGKFRATVGGLFTAAFSPAGLAVTGLTVGLSLLTYWQEKSAAAAQKHQQNVTSLASALKASTTGNDEAVRAAVAQVATQNELWRTGNNLLQQAKEYGVELSLVTDAGLGSSEAFQQILATLIQTQGPMAFANNNVRDFWNGLKILAATTAQARGEIEQESEAVKKNSTLTQELSYSQELTKAATEQLSGAFETLSDATSSASDKAGSFRTILDTLTGRTPAYEESLQTIHDAIREIHDVFGDAKDHANGFGKALINANGTVNTTTENGSKLQNLMVTLQAGFTEAGAAIGALVQSGMSLDAATRQVSGALTQQRQRFIESAAEMGITKAQAEKLANTYGLIPSAVTTNILQPGMPNAQQAADILRGKVLSIPDSKTVITSALTQDAVNRLNELGYKVNALPNGQVKVSADTSPFTAKVNSVIAWALSRTVGIGVGAAFLGVAQGRAQGGPIGRVIGRANGGMVRGPGGPTDDAIPARTPDGTQYALSNGEFIVNAAATKRHVKLLQYLNRSSVPAPSTASHVMPASEPAFTGGGGGFDYAAFAAAVAAALSGMRIGFDAVGNARIVQRTLSRQGER